ncbi:MAG: hypothetical protein KC549_00765, partial [Myxococcales bacterium]|nr:hypothetical protein [Myxococcales bacterium]
TLESCDLRGRWERLACPEGEICSVEEGPAACVRDLDIIGGGDGGVTDGGPRPIDGRLVEGDGTWPPAESAAQDLPVLDNLDERVSLRLPLLTDGVNREDTPIARAMRRIGTGGRVRFWRYQALAGRFEGIGRTGRIHLDQAGSPIPWQVPVLGDYPPVTGEEACAGLDACGAGFDGCLAAAAETSPTYLACATFQLAEDCARLPDLPMLCPNVDDAELRRDAEAGVLRYPEGVEVDPSLPIRERLFDGLTAVDLAAEVVHRTTAPAPYSVVQARPRGDGEGGVAVATAGQDHVVLRWGLGDERATAALPRAGEAPDLRAVRPDGQVVVLALNRSGDPALDGGLSVWNLAEGQWISSIRPPVGAQTIGTHVAWFSLDNRHLVFDVDGRLLEVWDLQAEQRTAILDYGDEAPPALVALAPNGRTLAIARQVEVTVQIDLFDLQAGGRLAGFSDRGRLLVQDLWSMAFTEDGNGLTIAGFTRDQELWLAVLGL